MYLSPLLLTLALLMMTPGSFCIIDCQNGVSKYDALSGPPTGRDQNVKCGSDSDCSWLTYKNTGSPLRCVCNSAVSGTITKFDFSVVKVNGYCCYDSVYSTSASALRPYKARSGSYCPGSRSCSSDSDCKGVQYKVPHVAGANAYKATNCIRTQNEVCSPTTCCYTG